MADQDGAAPWGGIEPRVFQALGQVCVSWAHIEALASDHLAHFLQGHPAPMLIVTNNVGAGSQLSWIRTLAKIAIEDPETLEEYVGILNQLNELRGERNAYIHGIWTSGDLAPLASVQTIKLDRAEVIKEELVSAADLEDFVAELVEASHAFRAIGRRIGILSV